MEENQAYIPEGWTKILFGDAIQVVKNGFSGVQVNYITPFAVTRIETISNGNVDFGKIGFVNRIPEVYKLTNGDILLSNINSVKHIGKIAYYDKDEILFHGMNLLLLRFHKEIDKKFIYYYLLTRKKWFEKEATQAINQASINQNTLKKHLLLTIPKSTTEQTQIATILTKVDEAITKTEQLIAKYTRIKTGLMQDLLTKGIDENGNIRSEETHEFKDSALGRIPKEWECEKLISYCQKIQDGTHFSPKTDTNGKYKYVTSKNIRMGYLDLSNLEFINEEAHNKIYKRCSIKFGDVLLTKDGASTGNICLNNLKEEFSLLSSVALIRGKAGVLKNEFIFQFFMEESGQKSLIGQMSGNAIPRITLTKINNTFIKVPSFKEQEVIVQKLKPQDELINEEKIKLTKLQSLKTGLMQDLLSGKVRVNHLIKETESV